MSDLYISSTIKVNRFGFFLTNLHMVDNSTAPKRDDVHYDKLFKVRKLLDTLSETFLHYYKPGKYQSCDEGMIKYTGRSTRIL